MKTRSTYRNSRTLVALLALILVMALLSSCTAINPEEPGKGGEGLQTYQGKTAIVVEDTELYDVYTIHNGDAGEQIIHKPSDGFTLTLKKNDILLVIEEADEYYRVTRPYGEPPRGRGKVEKAAVSFDEELFVDANQVMVDALSYDGIDGNVIEHKSGVGFVEQSNEDWCQVMFVTGDGPYWVKRSELTYNFDYALKDVDPYMEQ